MNESTLILKMTIVNIEKSQLELKIAIRKFLDIDCGFCEELFCLQSASALENISLEYTGEKTEVRTDHKYWTENFSDGSYSKLFYHWIDKTKFELEFIESNNHARKNFSKKGDKYIYEIINKEGDFYWILCEIPGQSEILKFKLFIDQWISSRNRFPTL